MQDRLRHQVKPIQHLVNGSRRFGQGSFYRLGKRLQFNLWENVVFGMAILICQYNAVFLWGTYIPKDKPSTKMACARSGMKFSLVFGNCMHPCLLYLRTLSPPSLHPWIVALAGLDVQNEWGLRKKLLISITYKLIATCLSTLFVLKSCKNFFFDPQDLPRLGILASARN